MKKFNEKAVIASAKEMNEAGLFINSSNDNEPMLWIKWHWDPLGKKDEFAPVVSINDKKDGNTHFIEGEENMFFKLNLQNGKYMFENFISKHVSINRL